MNNKTLKLDSLSFIISVILFLFLCTGIILSPYTASQGALEGIECCISVLVPSLFPFIFLSSYAVMSGISDKLGKLFSKITLNLFSLPSETGVTVFLSLIGGFPTGAAGISSLYKRRLITAKQAQRMLYFCVNSGPGFLISVVGAKLYKNAEIGYILTAVQITVSILTGIFLSLFAKEKEPLQISGHKEKTAPSFSEAFISSCRSACLSMAMMCSLVVLFSCFTDLTVFFLGLNTNSAVGILFRSICEVTDGCTAIADTRLPIYFVAACIGFGGICVHLQIFSYLSDIKINRFKFISGRIISGLLCGTVTYIICRVYPVTVSVFSNNDNVSYQISSATHYGSIALMISMTAFLICTSGIFKKPAE